MRSIGVGLAFIFLAACSHEASETRAPSASGPPMITVQMYRTSEAWPGEAVGAISITPGTAGAIFLLNLHDVAPGSHGFHVHEAGDCSAAISHGAMTPAGAAGGHWDPRSTGRHAGPVSEGHLGDLPHIEVGGDGRLSGSVTAPRITNIEQLRGHALMIHAGSDNYSDTPQPLGGGGARIACGVIG